MANFKPSVRLVDTVSISSNVSEDRQAASVLFANLQAALGGVRGDPLVTTRAVSVVVPLEGNDKGVVVNQIVRGFVDVRPGARASLFAQLGGKPVQVPLVRSPAGKGGKRDYTFQVQSTLAANASYTASLLLLVERDTDAEDVGAHLTVDSLDLEIKKGPKKKG